MKVLVLLVLAHVVLLTHAITVPPIWHRHTANYQHHARYHNTPHNRPNRQNFLNKPHLTPVVHKVKYKNSHLQTESYWVPITPNPVKTFHPYNQQFYVTHPTPYRRKHSSKQHLPSRVINKTPNSYQTINYVPNSHVDRNIPFSPIRGSYIHSIPPFNQGVPDEAYKIPSDTSSKENLQEIKSNYDASISEHEIPKDVPTKPIYPGEGQWARPGIKHKPYINNQQYSSEHEEDEKPDGHDIFERGEERFRLAQNQYQFNSEKFPGSKNFKESQADPSQISHTDLVYDKPDIGFVPQKLYAQVRRTETEKHLPRSAIDPEEDDNAGRLREIIKDSKIQTVYTEEGYEDSAYDHAGHEKKAEHSEGHAQREEGEVKGAIKNVGMRKVNHSENGGHNKGRMNYRRTKNSDQLTKKENYEDKEAYDNVKKKVEQEHDSESAGSVHAIKVPLSKKVGQQRNLQATKDMQKTKIKTMKNGDDVNMEIHTEVKIMKGPERKKHRFVKIVPSFKNIADTKINLNMSDFQNKTTNSESSKSRKRVKRYNRDQLSSRYVRKRPNYYWKKSKTSTFKPEIISKKLKAEYTTRANSKFSTSTIKSSTTTTTSKKFLPVTVKITKFHKRRKRYTIDHPDLEVSLEKFVDIENFADSTKKPDQTHIKYPYFQIKSKDIHEYSPLRYAEDLNNIPKKTHGDMAFYESRSNIECPEVEQDVDPIPDRIKNKGEEEEDESEEENKEMETSQNSPRLKGLGDKIDCLKIKYFGENPLDSPIFKEEVIKLTVPPVFKKPYISANNFLQNEKNVRPTYNLNYENVEIFSTENILPNKNSKKRELKNLPPIIVLDEEQYDSVTNNPIDQQAEAVLKPPYTFKEMVDKITDTKKITIPNSIYDQINLLEQNEKDLPVEEKDKPAFLIIYDSHNNSKIKHMNIGHPIENKIKALTFTTKGNINPRISDIIPDLSNLSREIPSNEIINLVPENFTAIDIISPKSLEDMLEYTSQSTASSTEATIPPPTFSQLTAQPNDKEDTPQSLPIFVPVARDLPEDSYFPKPKKQRFSSFIFDISKFLPQVKNHKIITSEVQYKDEIKPSEQMNVYSDVLKAINISTQETPEYSSDNADQITVKLQISSNSVNKRRPKRIRIRTTTIKPTEYFQTMMKPLEPITESSNNFDIHETAQTIEKTQRISPQIFPTETPLNRNSNKNPDNLHNHPLEIHIPDINYMQETDIEEITGLVPPTNNKNEYRTILETSKIPLKTPQDIGIVRQSRHINTFYVMGLRPPKQNQLVLNYDDYLISKRLKRNIPREKLRDGEDLMMSDSEVHETYEATLRKPIVYKEIVRARIERPQTENEDNQSDAEEEEDLLPRKRVYEIKPIKRTTTTEPYEEEEEIIVEEIKPTVQKPYLQPSIKMKPTGLPDYIKIIDQLHNYRFKNNITTTLPEQETTTANPRTSTTTTTVRTQMVAESINIRRGEPAYLQIINHLHEIRKDEEESKSTTESSDIFPVSPVQNSNPYIVPEALTSIYEESSNENKDSENSSHVRNLSSKFKTNIDTSKYKTIERTPVVLRHNLSSRFNSDDQTLPLERMFTTKMPVIYTTNKNIEIVTDRQEISTDKYKSIDVQVTDIISEYAPTVTTEKYLYDELQNLSTTTSTTSIPRRRTRPRMRPTTVAKKNVESSTNPIVRRRPMRVRSTTTTTTSTEPTITTTRTIPLLNRRRTRQKLESQRSQKSYVSEIPPNHRSEYVSVEQPKRAINQPETVKSPRKRRLEKLHERRVTSEYTMMRYSEPEELDESSNENLNNKMEYEIIGKIKNPEMRHGGNYKHINDAVRHRENNEQEEERYQVDDQDGDRLLMDQNIAVDANSLKGNTNRSQTTVNDVATEVPELPSTWKPPYSKYILHPSLRAKITNRLTRAQSDANFGRALNNEDTVKVRDAPKPKIIKDPSQRMYFYAKL